MAVELGDVVAPEHGGPRDPRRSAVRARDGQSTGGDRTQIKADYIILSVPATALRAIEITPDLPLEQAKVF